MAIPDYLQDTAKDYAKQATATYSAPIDTSKFTGQQFVAGEDPLQTSAINLATSGVGSYQPYLTAAQQNLTNMGGLTGASAYQPFMSPYQTDVIDTTLSEFDRQAQKGLTALGTQAIGQGAFGGGRHGVAEAEYQSMSDANRAALQAQMLQSGFQNAQQAAQTAFGNQQALGAGQMGLSNFQRAGLGADVGALGQLGTMRQGVTQAQLQADQQAAQTAAYEPYGRLSQYGTGITGLAGGMAPMQYQAPQQQSPWASALSTALGIGGLYGQIYNKRV